MLKGTFLGAICPNSILKFLSCYFCNNNRSSSISHKYEYSRQYTL